MEPPMNFSCSIAHFASENYREFHSFLTLWFSNSTGVQGDSALCQQPAENTGSCLQGDKGLGQNISAEINIRSESCLSCRYPENVFGQSSTRKRNDGIIIYRKILFNLENPCVIRTSAEGYPGIGD